MATPPTLTAAARCGSASGAVDVGPGGGVQHELQPRQPRRRQRDVPVLVTERDHLVVGERLDESVAQLPAGAGYEQAAASRGETIGVVVLHRCRDPRIGPAETLLVRIGRVVLLRHVIAEQEIGQRLEAVGVPAGDVDGDRVLVADVLRVDVPACRGRARRPGPCP